ncbi:MAG: MalY/PatB family protein [Dysgonomonas sp.]
MTTFDFDKIIDRRGTNALKTDVLKARYGREDLIPLWVADMDFLSPPTISEALIERAKHGIFGYTRADQEYYDSIINWEKKHYNWDIRQEWISYIPGVVKGIAFVIDCFTRKEDRVIIQPPVYHPFRIIPTLHHRGLVYNQLILDSGQYKMDLDDLKSRITSDCKVLILCNPHNPAGRVWAQDELSDIADICYENNILVIADEIHCDLAFAPHQYIPFASVSQKAAMNSITLKAPSKTFNIAGIVSSYAVVPNDEIRKKFYDYLVSSELDEADLFAYLAAKVAYQTGEEWLIQVKKYIWENICWVDEYLKNKIPQIKVIRPQASFLVWLDCRDLNLTQKELVSLFVNEAKLALNDGAMFGDGGMGFMRMNVGTSRLVLEKALNNLNIAVNK